MNNEKEPNDIVNAILFYKKIWKSIPFMLRGCIVGISIAWATVSVYSGDFSSQDWGQATRGNFLLTFMGISILYFLLIAATEDSL
ncbi:hypothetical protein [Leptospira brenneri]|uniref:hypothetical protein n=1 Tax=Leptospira brenneri TaxID=2023182 RepID=UPI000C2B3604|nr:hypothetical protein [Leptospira brenneri]PJZ43704.1 hypothetical protein CH361_19190 [Leptospira brenneri]